MITRNNDELKLPQNYQRAKLSLYMAMFMLCFSRRTRSLQRIQRLINIVVVVVKEFILLTVLASRQRLCTFALQLHRHIPSSTEMSQTAQL